MFALTSWDFYDHWQYGWEIGKLGQSLAEGQGISIMDAPTAKFPPVYPLVVGAVFAVFGVYSTASAIVLFLIQSTFSATIGVLLAILGNRFFGRREGLVAGLVWAFYPTAILYSVKFVWYSELAVMLILLQIVLATKPEPFRPLTRTLCLGALSGLVVMSDSTMTVYPVLLLLWTMYAFRLAARQWVLGGLVWLVAFGVCVSPWGIRNYVVFGTPGILKSNFGLELFFGNNPYSTGGGIDAERYQALNALDPEESEYHREKSEHSYYAYLQREAIEWIRAHPMKFVLLTAKRCWFFWGKFPSSGPGPWKRHGWKQLAWYAPVALSALYCIWCCRGRRWSLMPIWLFLLVYPLPFYITHVQLYRYRYPVEAFLVLLAAVPLTKWVTRCMGRLGGRQQAA
jgi:hypothetical protein